MPAFLIIVGLITAALAVIIRTRNAANASSGLRDMANDVRRAALRFGFKRVTDLHPAESIRDPAIAVAGIASAFVELDGLPTSDQRSALVRQMRSVLSLPAQDADELAILGRWIAAECGPPDAAISRLSRKLARLGGNDSFAPLLTILNGTLSASSVSLNTRQKEALDDVRRAFRVA